VTNLLEKNVPLHITQKIARRTPSPTALVSALSRLGVAYGSRTIRLWKLRQYYQVKVLVLTSFMDKIDGLQGNDWRPTRLLPLNGYFVTAGSSLDATEMSLVRRLVHLLPLLCNLCMSLFYLRRI